MATVTSLADNSTPIVNTGVQVISKSQAWTNAIANSGDQVNVLTFRPGFKGKIVGCVVRTSATLGAGCTIQARVNRSAAYTALSAATTAGAASKADDSAQAGVPFDAVGGDIIELLVGGANVTAGATVTVDLLIAGAAS